MSLILRRLCAAPFLLLALLAALPATAQTALSEGDLAILAVDPYLVGSFNDQFSFVLLVDVEAGTVVRFTDYDAAANGTLSDDGADGEITVTLAALTAGTVVTVNVGATVTLADPSQGTPAVTSSGFGLSQYSGDNLVAYQGGSVDVDPPSGDDFLYYVNAGESGPVAPSALGADAVVVFGSRTIAYDTRAAGANAPTSGTALALIEAFNDTDNYYAANANIDPEDYLPASFTVLPAVSEITVSPISVTVSESGTTAAVDVTLSRSPSADLTIDVSSTDASEASVSTSRLTFASGTTTLTQRITITGVDDAILDGNVTFTVELSPAESGDTGFDGVDPDDVAVTTLDDEVTLVRLEASTTELGEEDETEAVLTALLSSPASGPIVVDLDFAGSAQRGLDYEAPTQIVVPNGATSASVTLTVLSDDENEEGDEVIRASIAAVGGNAQEEGDQQVRLTLADSRRSLAQFTVVQQGLGEDAGSVSLGIRLNRLPETPGQAIVTLVSGDPADLGGFTSEAVDIATDGAFSYTLTIPITDDALAEGNETFVFELSSTDGVDVGDESVTALVIVDNDGQPVAMTIPARDADGDGEEDGGPRLLALPVNGVTAGDLAAAAGADAVLVLDPETGAFVEADPELLLLPGQPVLVDVAAGAELAISGTVPGGDVAYSPAPVAIGEDMSRALVALGNPTDRALALDAFMVTGGTLADVALVFDPAAGSFRPVRIEDLGALALGPFDVVVLQVVPSGDVADVAVSVATDAPTSAADLVSAAGFTPADGETAVVLALRPATGDGATAQVRVEADAPGDTFVLRLIAGASAEIGAADAVDLFAPGGGQLASAGSGAVLAAEARDALSVGQSVTIPLMVSVPEAGAYEIALANLPGSVDDRPVVVEVLDGATATVVSDGAPFAFTADASMTGPEGASDRFSVRVTVLSNVATETGSPAAPALAVWPNPTASRATVSLARASGTVRVAVYDALGREVAQLHDGPVTADASWPLADLSPGVYVIRATGSEGVWVRSFTVVR